MPYRSKQIRRAAGPPRKTLWVGIDATRSTLTAAGGTITNSANAALLALRPFTIVRTLMQYQLLSDQAASIEQQVLAVGGAVVSDQALAIGVTAVPTPSTDVGSDLWFFHRWAFGDNQTITDRAQPATRFGVESRAMRKVQDGEDIVFVVELNALGEGIDLFSAGRMLIKLH